MTVPSTISRINFAGAGSTGPFAFPFRIFSTDDLLVTKRSATGIETPLTYGSNWTLTAGTVVGQSTGSITLVTALAVGEVLTVRRAPALTQNTSIENQSDYFAKTHQDVFDRLTMMVQGLADRVGRTFALGETQDPAVHATLLTPTDGTVLGWTGGQLGNVKVDTVTGVVLPGLGRTVATLSALLSNNIVTFNVKDFGATGDGVTDDTVAVKLAFDTACARVITDSAAQDLGIVLYFPRGKYLLTDTINVSVNRVHVRGDGKYASTILFSPAAAKACFFLSNVTLPGSLYQGSFSKLGFRGTGAQQKIAIDGLDLSEYVFEDLVVSSSWTGNSGNAATPSIGIRVSARELLTISRCDIFADRPFHFRKGTSNFIGADHFHFHDLYMNALVATEVGILVDVDCIITSWIMDGYQSWIGGTYGIHSLASASCLSVNIRNARYEQPGATGGFALWWEATTKGLILDGCNFGGVAGATNGGAKIRNSRCITFLNCLYTGSAHATAIALDVDGTCDDINLINFFAQNTALVNGLANTFYQVWSVPQIDGSAPFAPTSYWTRSNAGALRTLRLLGVDTDYEIFDIVSGGLVNLVTNGQTMVTALLDIGGYSAVGPIEEAGLFLLTASSAKAVAVTANCAAGNVAGKLCVLWNSNQNIQILNNTAQTLKVVMSIKWRR